MIFNKLEKFFTNITFLASFLMFFLIIFTDKTSKLSFSILPFILLGVLCFVFKKLDVKNFKTLFFFASLFITVSITLVIDTQPISDFALIYDSSLSLLDGDTSFKEFEYFTLWAYQSFWVIFQAGILFLWNNILSIKLVNCVLLSFCNLFVYEISCEFFSKKASQILAVFHLFFAVHMCFVTVLSNNIFSAFFMYLAIYILLCNKLSNLHFCARYSIVGLILSIGNMLRPDAIVVILSILAYSLIKVCSDKTLFTKICLQVFCLLASYFALSYIVAFIIIKTGVNPYGLANNNPLWKFVIGFNHETNGSYSNGDFYLISRMMDYNNITRDDAQLILIKERLNVPFLDILTLFRKKIQIFWTHISINWSIGHLNHHPLYIHVYNFTTTLYLIVRVFASIGLISLLRNKIQPNHKKCFLLFILLATFIVYLFIEVQSRYAFFVQFIYFILACGGLDFTYEFFSKHIKKLKSN